MEEVSFPQQTPLYYALHAERYARRDLIEQVERVTGRKLIVYFANVSHPQSLCAPTNQLWEAVWRLHTYYEVFVRRHQTPKIHETSRVSIS